MPDLSIPSNAFPINRSSGTRAVADIVLHKVVNPTFWPEEVPPVREVQYPFLNIRAYDAGLRAERVFSPFHRANLYDIRTITWLLSIQFISPDDLTEEDCCKVDAYKRCPEGRIVWHPDSEYSLTGEQKSAWVEKYQRRDAFFRRKETHDAVRSKRQFFREMACFEWQMLPESSRPPKPKIDSYDYTRDVLGGRLREVRPIIKAHRRRFRKHERNLGLFTDEEKHLLADEMYKLYGVDQKPRFIPFINRLNGKATVKAAALLPLPPCAYMLRDDVSRTIAPLPIVHADTAHDGTSAKDANSPCAQTPVCCTGKGPSEELPNASDSHTLSVAASVLKRQCTKQSPDKDAHAADATRRLVEPLKEDASSMAREQPMSPCYVAGPPSVSRDAPLPVHDDALLHAKVNATTSSTQLPVVVKPKEPTFDEDSYPSYHDEEVEALIDFDEEMMLDVEIWESGMEQAMQDIKAKFPKTRLPSKGYRQRHSQQEVINGFCTTANIDGIRRHRRDPKLKGNKDKFMERKKEWVPLHSQLRNSVIIEGDEYVSSYAFNHKTSLDECQLRYQPRVNNDGWYTHTLRQKEMKDLGVLFPRYMVQQYQDDAPLYHWLGKEKPCTLMSYVRGQWASFVGLRGTSVGHSVVKVRANWAYTRIAAGWTGQPVVTEGYY